jgi:hypothetical protein
MPLPEGYQPFEHLQSVVRNVHNRLVREEFADLGGDDWDADITTPRGSLRQACTLQDNDTADMIQMRYNLFYLDLRKAKDYQVPVYGTPLPDLQASRKFKPQITLFFREDIEDVDEDRDPVWGEISFRLMDEIATTITEAELRTLGQKIKTEFGAVNGYIWKKGRGMYSYTDKDRGYQFQILARTKQDAKDLVNKVLDVQSHTPDWKRFNAVMNEEEGEKYPYNPGTQSILGKTRKKPLQRPLTDVRFQYALAHIHGLPRAVCIYDRSYTFMDALVD